MKTLILGIILLLTVMYTTRIDGQVFRGSDYANSNNEIIG